MAVLLLVVVLVVGGLGCAGIRTIVREPSDEFCGDRLAMIEDPFGCTWTTATRTEDIPPVEIDRRRRAAAASFPGGGR